MDWQKIAPFLCFLVVQSLFAGEKRPKDVSVTTLLRSGFSPRLAAKWKEKANGPRDDFFLWKRSLTGRDASLVSKLWKTEGLNYPPLPPPNQESTKLTSKKETRFPDKKNELSNHIETPSGDPSSEEHLFVGLGYQNLDVQYLPREEKNHSFLSFGGYLRGQRMILEKRDESIAYGLDLKYDIYRFTTGNRYKPIPHFYFAKDPNFYSQMDRTNSPLPQPIQDSQFLGIQLPSNGNKAEIGFFYAPGFSYRPGIYFTSANKSYSGVWSPEENKSSLFVNDSYHFQHAGKHRVQSESIFDRKESVGFLYTKSEFYDSKFFLDSTFYRDSPLLYGNVTTGDIRPEIPQTLGYVRGSYKYILGGEGLSSVEGHRFETGGSGFLPMIVSEYGNLLYRYRQYQERGNFQYNEIGRALFYEWRKNRTVLSIGFEKRELAGQWEGKIAVPIQAGHLLELSAIFREGNPKTRAWFENWTYASDFNINLTDREEIIKLKYVSPLLSLNISYSEKENSPMPILFINFQFLHLFEI